MFYIKDVMAYSDAYKRPENQDCCFYMNYDGSPHQNTKISILAVLDGVSKANGGEASQQAAEAMRPVLAELLGKSAQYLQLDMETRKEVIFQVLRRAIHAADHSLRMMQYANVVYGTTVTLAVILDDQVYAANVGDSPAYLLPVSIAGQVSASIPLFECQNYAGKAVREGTMTMEQARAEKLQNRLVSMVGGYTLHDDEISTTSVWLRQSNLLLLGSDGALAVTTEEELRQTVEENLRSGLREVIKSVFENVQNSDSTDNFTILAEWVDSD